MAKSGPKPRPFWSQVDIGRPGTVESCWEWTGGRFSNGYGRAIVERGSVGAHRRAYELFHGAPIPDGLSVCHRCDNRLCVRPSHLFLGTTAENSADMVAKGRSLSGSRNPNARLTEDAARQIRERYAAGGVTQKQLADEFGVVEGAIWNVLHGQAWKAVA